jgi:hypothetical protein
MAISLFVSSSSAPDEDAFKDDEATAQRAAAAIRVMTGALDSLGEAGSVTRAPEATARVFPVAFGWFAAIVRNAQLVALAHENGLRHESAASARLVLQHAMALQWLIEGGDPAVDAVEAEGHRNAFDLVKELADTNWPLPAGFTLEPGDRPAKHGALEHQFGNFKAMCALYRGGDQSYVPYRVQSGNAHPSHAGAMAYVIPETGELSTTAVTDTYAYLIDTARCAILAGHAFSPLLADASIADAVAQAEAVLGMEFGLWKRN